MPLILAVLLDLLLGDPSNRFHPTAWMGSFIAFFSRFRPKEKPALEFTFGGLLMLVGLTFVGGIGLGLTWLFSKFIPPLNLLLTALVLKTTFSLRGLDRASREVQTALEHGDLPAARQLLSWHLVSRDTSQLSGGQVAAAAVESIAENASDSLVAPLFFFLVGGLPLALVYRFANTADAMLGYHDPGREWFGKIPARLDDVLNIIPARLTGLLLVFSAALSGCSAGKSWKIMLRDAHLTASPNAGFPMSAMAGALSIELEKVDHYCLGKGYDAPQISDLSRARRVYAFLAGLVVLLFSVLTFFIR